MTLNSSLLCLCPLGWGTLRLAVFSDSRIRSGVSWVWWQSVEAVRHGLREDGVHVRRGVDFLILFFSFSSFSFFTTLLFVIRQALLDSQWAVLQALNLSGEVRFIAGPLFMGLATELKAFLGCVGYSPVSDSHNKKGHVPYLCVRGALDKYQDTKQYLMVKLQFRALLRNGRT